MVRSDKFLCTWPECGRTYAKSSKLAEHVRSHTNTRPYVCDHDACGKTFLRNGHLQRHLLTHSSSRPFPCPHCPKTFTLQQHLRRHQRLHESTYQCHCGNQFARKEQLRRHLLSHSPKERGEKTYACGVDGCMEQFKKWTLVVAHRKTHTTVATCEECQKTFGKNRNLQAHIKRVHAGIKQSGSHLCDWEDCKREFSSKNALKVHLATVHEKIKPYTCEKCEKSFGHKHLLVRHRRTHEREHESEEGKGEGDLRNEVPVETLLVERLTGAGEYLEGREIECPVVECKKRFMREYDLQRHIQSVHPPVA